MSSLAISLSLSLSREGWTNLLHRTNEGTGETALFGERRLCSYCDVTFPFHFPRVWITDRQVLPFEKKNGKTKKTRKVKQRREAAQQVFNDDERATQ